MALRYLGEYITQIRRDTNTKDSSFTNGIPDDQIVEYLRDGQDRLQSKIFSKYPTLFEVETTFSPVANQESYTPASDEYAVNSIASLEYSPTGVDRDYYFLKKNILQSRTNVPVNYPSFYIQSGNRLLIQPKINTAAGLFRLVYTKALPSLDIRRGVVLSTTSDGTYYTSVTLDPAGSPTPDDTNLASVEYISIVDRHGNIKYSGIPITGYNSTTKVLTIETSTCPMASGTISGGYYVTIGAVSTTHSILPSPMGGRYLLAYGAWRVFGADNAIAAGAKEQELTAYENDIMETFAAPNRDIPYIPWTEDFI